MNTGRLINVNIGHSVYCTNIYIRCSLIMTQKKQGMANHPAAF